MQHIKKEVRDLLPFFFLVIVETQIADDSPGVGCLDKRTPTLTLTVTQALTSHTPTGTHLSHSHRHSPPLNFKVVRVTHLFPAIEYFLKIVW